MKSEHSKNLSLLILAIFFIGFVYLTAKVLKISSDTQISTNTGIYTNKVSSSKEIIKKSYELTKNCKSELCEVQNILDYVTQIPYQVNHFRANSPQKTIQNNFGDCDDKSNLLISMLHALGKEAYFVLVPKHIFVITPIKDKRLIHTKGLYIDDTKYFILESTAKGSQVGFPLRYEIKEISEIVEPFSNEKVDYRTLGYKI